MSITIGLDIGGTKCIAAAADEQGVLVRKTDTRSTPLELHEGLSLINTLIHTVAGDDHIRSIGVSIGGPINYKTGEVSPLHQPNWRKIPLKKMLEHQWQCPCYIDVDTNAAALGEYHLTEDKPNKFVYLTLSTGMGGGILVDGKVYRGTNDEHPEVGHQAIPYHCSSPTSIRCACGAPDCLEALVSGNAIRRIYGCAPENLPEQQWAEVSYNLSQGIRNIAALYAPDLIVIGGGVAIGRGTKLIDAINVHLQQYVYIVPIPKIRLSVLGHNTALYGSIRISLAGM